MKVMMEGFAKSAKLVTLACVAAVLASCGPVAKQKKGPVEIVYWTGWSGDEQNIQQELVDEFNKTHPNIRVRLLSQFSLQGYQKVRIAFAGAATPELMSTVWAEELPAYAMRGVIEPLEGYLKASGRDVNKEFTPGVAKMLQINGHVYGLAVTTNAHFLAYNRALYKECGLDPDRPPQTPEELDAVAKKTTLYKKDGTLKCLGYRAAGLMEYAYVYGGQWYDDKTKRITANDPRNVAALEWLASYGKQYDLKRVDAFRAGFGNDNTNQGPFYTGQAVNWYTGEWIEAFIKRYAPKLDWGYFALPAPKGGRPYCTAAGGSVFVIPKACKHKKETWEFLNWITSPYAVKKFCLGVGNVPPLREVGLDPEVQAIPLMRFAFKIVNGPNAFGPPPIPIWATYQREINRAEEKAVLGGQKPQAVLDDLQKRMDSFYRQTMKDLGQ